MTPFVHSLALLVLASTLVAATTPPAATTCPARLFGLQASAARNSTGHENLKAVLQQPEGAAWHLDVAAEEQRAAGGERIRVTTFALSADADAAGEGGKGACAELEAKMEAKMAAQEETIAELRASNEELKASMALVQKQRNGTGNEREDAELQAKMATLTRQVAEGSEELKASMALLQRHLDASVAELKANNAALRGRLQAVTETLSTTTSTRPLTSEERSALSKKLLAAAAGYGHVQEVRELLAQGAGTEERDVNQYQYTPLHLAARNGDVETLQLLVAHGASLDARDVDRDTPLHRAAANGRTQAVEALLAAGADPRLRNDDGETARDLAENDATRALLPA